jgi:hypothetical protein
MKQFLIMLFIVASFSASAKELYGTYNDDPLKPFNASHVANETVAVTWKRVPNNTLKSVCNAESIKRKLGGITWEVNACTFWEGHECVMITGESTTMWTLGHESRHCFQQSWH